MRVISKFSDYYDAVMKTGMDREVVYVRETKNVELEKKYDLALYSSHSSNHSVVLYYLGYCGQIFKIIELKVNWTVSTPESRYIFFSYQSFKDFMLAYNIGSQYDFRTSRWWPSSYQKFDEYNTAPLIELFHQHQTPLFLISSKNRDGKKQQVTIGPKLKDLEFQKVKDTYTAYQDIFQYVAGTLNKPEATMVKISDKDKIHKHGFDKWSFRKMPTKKK